MHEELEEDFNDILESIMLIQNRFTEIHHPDEFVNSPYGILIFDSIVMRLQYIGEQLKNIDKFNEGLLEKYSEISWSEIIRLRDLISHHYEDIDHEVIHNICLNHLADLKRVIEKIIKEN
jgi:uncharacterized protein with HEPN domain